jgi:hypothetical protein
MYQLRILLYTTNEESKLELEKLLNNKNLEQIIKFLNKKKTNTLEKNT